MKKDYRIALRPDVPGKPDLDDVVVKDVSMFRMEQMDTDHWWLCCYLAGSDERIDFEIYREGKSVVAQVSGYPVGDFTYEAGSVLQEHLVWNCSWCGKLTSERTLYKHRICQSLEDEQDCAYRG